MREPLDRFLSHFRAAQEFSAADRGAFHGAGQLAIPAALSSSAAHSSSSGPGHHRHHHGASSVPGGGCMFHHCRFADFLHWLAARRSDPTVAPASLKLPWTLGDFALRYFVGFDACDPGGE